VKEKVKTKEEKWLPISFLFLWLESCMRTVHEYFKKGRREKCTEPESKDSKMFFQEEKVTKQIYWKYPYFTGDVFIVRVFPSEADP
jgi:hypothetical protein